MNAVSRARRSPGRKRPSLNDCGLLMPFRLLHFPWLGGLSRSSGVEILARYSYRAAVFSLLARKILAAKPLPIERIML